MNIFQVNNDIFVNDLSVNKYNKCYIFQVNDRSVNKYNKCYIFLSVKDVTICDLSVNKYVTYFKS